MKKVLTILVVLALVAGIAFADDPAPVTDTVTLTTSVAEIPPVFKLYYDKDSTGDKADYLYGTQEANSSITGGISADFAIWQEGEANGYSNYKEATVELTVTCGAFVGKAGTGTEGYASATPKASALVNGATRKDIADPTKDALTYGTFTGANTDTVVFKPKYHGKRVNDQEIATFTATWDAEPNLPFGDYTANITLSYTAN